ncbi:MAG TPA: hypothetical protein VLH80_07220 [Nitrospiraceae bacterium]|nr:hypothetical protein [Nitrospiraceae bacterium]
MTTEIDVGVRPPAREVYLGDAVYASFDGYQIWLVTKDGRQQRIALEPYVYAALREYAKEIWGSSHA